MQSSAFNVGPSGFNSPFAKSNNSPGFNNQSFNKPTFGQARSALDRAISQQPERPSSGHKRNDYKQKGYGSNNLLDQAINEQPAQTFGRHGHVSPFNKPSPKKTFGHKKHDHKQKGFGTSSLLDQAINEQPEQSFGRHGHVSPFNKPPPKRPTGQAQHNPAPFGQASSPFGQSTNQLFGQSNQVQPSPFGQSNTPGPFGQAAQAQLNPSPFGQTAQPFGQSNTPSPFGQNTQPFGQAAQPFGQAAQPFGQSAQPFGQSAQPFVQAAQPFGQTPQPFGQTPQAQVNPSPFGQTGHTQLNSSPFGQTANTQVNQSPFGQTTNKQSPFGQNTQNASPFGQPNNSQPPPPPAGRGFGQITQPNRRLNKSTDNLNSKQGFGQFVTPKVDNEAIESWIEKTENKKSSSTTNAARTSVTKRLGKTPMESMNMATQVQQKQQQKHQRSTKPKESINASLFLTNDPGRSTPEKRAQRFGQYQVLYQEFKDRRVIERKQAIKDGLIPNPDEQTSLEDAIDFRGTCTLKCPEFEMLERDMQNDLDDLEKDSEGNIDPEKAVKKYRRSAAGGEQPLPSDVRTPDALNDTLDYLVSEILAKHAIDKCHKFVRDRTRSIRQDFTLQNIRDISAVHTHERIARFHILSLHEMCEYDEGTFSLPQEMEQLHKTLISLMEFYDDLRDEGIETENEAEFRAYHIISQIKDEDIAQRSMRLPIHIFKNPYMKRALEFRALSQRNNEILETSSRRNKPENIEASQNFYSMFFKLIADPSTPFLMACLLETHFSEVRKGALKAMNASYMMKAGGVQAEDVRQVLGYDTLKQLFREAMMYGIVINNSLGEPTLCFGQKHYAKKNFVFKEPLSNPSQRKSLLLVEPKKAGRSFEDIVNGVDPLPNQIPAAISLNPIVPPKAQEKKEEDKSQYYLDIKNQAELANQRMEEEKKKLEELMQKKKQEEEEKARLAAALEAEKRRKEEEIQREIMRQKQTEDERNMEVQRQQALVKERKEKEMANMRLKVLRSQACKKMFNEIMKQVLEEETKVAVVQNVHKQKVMKRVGLPWLQSARNRISKRRAKVMQLKENWHFNMHLVTHNPYIPSDDTIYKAVPSHAKPDGIKERTKYSLISEAIALEDKDLPSTHDAIWAAEDFSFNIYPRVRDKMLRIPQAELDDLLFTKPAWQLLIDVPTFDGDSSIWFQRKFGLDGEFHRKDSFYKAFDIKIRMITPDSLMACDTVLQTGGIIFSLPEGKYNKTQAESEKYWNDSKKRLDRLVKVLHDINPALKVPILFTYFPDHSNSEVIIEKIPDFLGLESNSLVSDYHILIMNPKTIVKRLREEVNWISRQ